MAPDDATARRSWQVWGLSASVVVTDPGQADAAARLAQGMLDAVDLACSRFRTDSELAVRRGDLVHGATVSPLLATLMESALAAARWTGGAVDPTLGGDLISLGYDADFASLPGPGRNDGARSAGRLAAGPSSTGLSSAGRSQAHAPQPSALLPGAPQPHEPRAPGWTRIALDSRCLTVPADVTVDLGATAKAVAADMAAARIAVERGCGVLVNLGGDIATAGPAPDGAAGHWQVLVQDTPGDPAQQVSLPAGRALATSSTSKRRWQQAGALRHHILDPRFGLPADAVWRSASVAAPTALEANAYSTAAIVKGHAAAAWLRDSSVSARLVDQGGRVLTTAGWPAPELAGAGFHG
ncbi:FAD:protein FMN transferase [Arthrobacter dokdonensis]|uniref:FAD:protein FMN transferase n=1 Tax=Arthrobacter dokdonellae TaxID=2211210 RepID=UPI001D1317FB|nr:FAD:protein FMN transferase [Arthrobacter dokdonellae]